MVRPRERYRHGAKRQTTEQLEPVYFITPYNSISTAISKKAEIYRGSEGKITEFYPWEYAPLALANTADPGVVDALAAQILTVNNTTIDSTSWTYEVLNQVHDMFEHLYNGVLYCTWLRSSEARGRASVTSTRTFQFAPPITSTRTEQLIAVSANYDILTVAVNLETGLITYAAAPLYQSDLTNVSEAFIQTGGAEYTFSRSIIYHGLRQAIAASLPTGHPFQSCGIEAWNFINNFSEPGDYAFATDPGIDGAFFLPQFRAAEPPESQFYVRSGSGFRIEFQSSSTFQRLQYIQGADLALPARVYGANNYLEFSTLGSEWLTCAGYAALGTQVASTWSEYSPAALTPREELLNVEGLDPVDQTSQLQDPSTAPVNSLPTAGAEEYSSSEPVYFREAVERPSFAGSLSTTKLSRHYLIID